MSEEGCYKRRKSGMREEGVGCVRKERASDVSHAQAVYVDDVIKSVDHEHKTERVQVDEALDKRRR